VGGDVRRRGDEATKENAEMQKRKNVDTQKAETAK
jgi:hypothetical protein